MEGGTGMPTRRGKGQGHVLRTWSRLLGFRILSSDIDPSLRAWRTLGRLARQGPLPLKLRHQRCLTKTNKSETSPPSPSLLASMFLTHGKLLGPRKLLNSRPLPVKSERTSRKAHVVGLTTMELQYGMHQAHPYRLRSRNRQKMLPFLPLDRPTSAGYGVLTARGWIRNRSHRTRMSQHRIHLHLPSR